MPIGTEDACDVDGARARAQISGASSSVFHRTSEDRSRSMLAGVSRVICAIVRGRCVKGQRPCSRSTAFHVAIPITCPSGDVPGSTHSCSAWNRRTAFESTFDTPGSQTRAPEASEGARKQSTCCSCPGSPGG